MSKIDKDKISDFKNNEVTYENYSSFCMKTKPNNRYFTKLIKNEVEGFMNVYGDQIKKEEPEKFFSIMNKKLPKRYQVKPFPTAPVNAFVPPQSKLSSDELRKQLDKDVKERKLKVQKEHELRQENKRKEVIKQRNQKAYAREQSYIHWVNPFTPINHNKLGSSQAWKIEKKYKYYD